MQYSTEKFDHQKKDFALKKFDSLQYHATIKICILHKVRNIFENNLAKPITIDFRLSLLIFL